MYEEHGSRRGRVIEGLMTQDSHPYAGIVTPGPKGPGLRTHHFEMAGLKKEPATL
jgi:hypothetical protein